VVFLPRGAYADCDGDACSAERAEAMEEEDAAGSNILLLQTALRFEANGVKACATGYEKVTGSMHGFGEVNGKGGGESVDDSKGCVSCAQKCSEEPDCLSYECSHTELKCYLDTMEYPMVGEDYKDSNFCVKEEVCATGYERVTAKNQIAWLRDGQSHRHLEDYMCGGCESVNEDYGCVFCAQKCSDEPWCKSYECSDTPLSCTLNTVRTPTPPRDYRGRMFCMKEECATGYEQVTGWVMGSGQVNGSGGGEEVDYCVFCAQKCSKERDCKSYMCSHADLGCDLNTVRHPTNTKYNYAEDFIFCMEEEVCASGYEEDVGDIGGWGSINSQGGGQTVTSCQQCAGFCDSYPACLSYECSLVDLKCNLNELREPFFHNKFRTYGFCKKEAAS